MKKLKRVSIISGKLKIQQLGRKTNMEDRLESCAEYKHRDKNKARHKLKPQTSQTIWQKNRELEFNTRCGYQRMNSV